MCYLDFDKSDDSLTDLKMVSQNARGMSVDVLKLEHIANLTLEKNVGDFLIQDAQLIGSGIKIVNVFFILYHGLKTKASSREECGVAIALSLALNSVYEDTGGLPPLAMVEDNEDFKSDRFILFNVKIRINHRRKMESSQGKHNVLP